MEDQADGGKHFHMALTLGGTKRWQPIKNSSITSIKSQETLPPRTVAMLLHIDMSAKTNP